ncbi:MAG: GNAT family N-acetyltransferase [Cryomorphaceae bacterium]|nr:GNAT family N-acetyltransferase [Cryomorphaceae bacterium]
MILIRKATLGDEKDILLLIKELAVYEKEPDAVEITTEELRSHLFIEQICEAIVAVDNEIVIGFALYYTSYSTWKGKCLYLEDLYIKAELRRSGVGKKLFQRVAEVAQLKKVRRMEWQVYDWNQPAIDFYLKLDAQLNKTWLNGRLEFDYNVK